jgi:L-aspartate oxidase
MGLPTETDFIVVGAGIAGLRAAITLAESGRVLVLTKESLGESNTSYAQGGIAVALGGDEDVALHLNDTVQAGDGLVDRAAAAILVEDGPKRVEELLQWGTGFDRRTSADGMGELMLTREGAHSLPRILHAHGDATGAEIGRSLLAKARSVPNIDLRPWISCVDLLIDESSGAALGLSVLDGDGTRSEMRARAVLLASGGAGQVYSDSTNPEVATGDGIAMAYRAGAEIADMEFYQFHPTALSLPGVPRFLLSEALRGEGAYLRNDQGERFMERYHRLLELAPRDVVARAITREGCGERPGETRPVYLDMRHVKGIDFTQRFPGISAFLNQHELDLGRDLIPVRPAAHYLMGGVRADHWGQTSMPRLYAAGEAACTGVHGANRLASNSLLEGLVFGARAAEAMRDEPALPNSEGALPPGWPAESRVAAAPAALLPELQRAMWEKAGLLRDGYGLLSLREDLERLSERLPIPVDRSSVEINNLVTIGSLIMESALAREESRGAHFRNDFPTRDDEGFARHSVVRRVEEWVGTET